MSQHEIHNAADKIEVRLARALHVYTQRLRKKLPLQEIRQALERGDVRAVDELLNQVDFEEGLEPSTRILTDAFMKGGKLTAKEIEDGD